MITSRSDADCRHRTQRVGCSLRSPASSFIPPRASVRARLAEVAAVGICRAEERRRCYNRCTSTCDWKEGGAAPCCCSVAAASGGLPFDAKARIAIEGAICARYPNMSLLLHRTSDGCRGEETAPAAPIRRGGCSDRNGRPIDAPVRRHRRRRSSSVCSLTSLSSQQFLNLS